jgi:1-aminocyclopropane-1-carboxylate deaminase/D-cysteine desulfhydrase-like pyridoxal-dependent ACC family enzyme
MSLQEKAFPNPHLTNETGMTLRDYFAAKAMQGLMSMDRANEFVDDQGVPDYDHEGTLFVHTKYLAEEAYMIADAMMEARK